MTEGELPLVEKNSKLAGEYDKEQLLLQRLCVKVIAVSSASDFISCSSVFVRCACEAVSDHFAHSL